MVTTLAANIHMGESRSVVETIASALKQLNYFFNKIQCTSTPTLPSFFYPNNNNKAGLSSPSSNSNYKLEMAWENGVTNALDDFSANKMKKVVLALRANLHVHGYPS